MTHDDLAKLGFTPCYPIGAMSRIARTCNERTSYGLRMIPDGGCWIADIWNWQSDRCSVYTHVSLPRPLRSPREVSTLMELMADEWFTP